MASSTNIQKGLFMASSLRNTSLSLLRNTSLSIAIAITIVFTSLASIPHSDQSYNDPFFNLYESPQWQFENEMMLHEMLYLVEGAMLEQLSSVEGRALSEEEREERLSEVSNMRNQILAPDSRFYTNENFLRPEYVDIFEDEVNNLSLFWNFYLY
jgi:hypothetical protein